MFLFQALTIFMTGEEGVEDGYEGLLIMTIPLVNEGLVRYSTMCSCSFSVKTVASSESRLWQNSFASSNVTSCQLKNECNYKLKIQEH